MLKTILASVPFKDFLAIYTGRVLKKMLSRLNYDKYYLPLYTLINYYTGKGYSVKSHKRSLQVQGKNEFAPLKFLLRPGTSDNMVFNQVIGEGEYKTLVNMVAEAGITNDKILAIIDAGANVGFTSLFLKTHFPKAGIVCVEADRDNSQQLKKNIDVNGLQGSIQVLNNALWSNDTDSLVVTSDFRDGGSWSKSVTLESKGSAGATTKVQCITVQKIAATAQLNEIDILKIDIEGAEAELFKTPAFVQFLAERVKFLAVEIHEEFCSRQSIQKILTDNHFECREEGETDFCINKKLVP